MLRHVVDAAAAVEGASVALLGPSRHGLAATWPLLDDPGRGLNAALASVVPAALAAGVDRLVFVSGDLPLVTAAEIDVLVRVAPHRAAMAPDRAGTGTNALSLPLPRAGGFRFGYGPASLERHRVEAARLGLPLDMLGGEGLAFDIDLPEDLALLEMRRRDSDT